MLALIRKAGDKVRQFDDAYAAKLAEYIGSFKPKNNSPGQFVQIGAGLSAGVPATRRYDMGPVDAEVNDISRLLNTAGQYGIPALNAGVRYGLPLTAAAGLTDLTGRLYDAASDIKIIPVTEE